MFQWLSSFEAYVKRACTKYWAKFFGFLNAAIGTSGKASLQSIHRVGFSRFTILLGEYIVTPNEGTEGNITMEQRGD